MHETRDPNKAVQAAQLRDDVEKFLANGGVVRTDSPPSEQRGQQRMKFTRKADEAIGYKPVERPKPKQEMTIMSATQKATVIPKKPVAAAPVKRPAVPREPAIDLAALVLEKDVPMPEQQRGAKSAWVPVLVQMEIGDSYFIPGKTPGNLGYVKKTALKNGIHIALFNVTEKIDGKATQGTRLFRVAPDVDVEVADDDL